MRKITFNSSEEFFKFAKFAVENGLAYTAEETDGIYVVSVTGY